MFICNSFICFNVIYSKTSYDIYILHTYIHTYIYIYTVYKSIYRQPSGMTWCVMNLFFSKSGLHRSTSHRPEGGTGSWMCSLAARCFRQDAHVEVNSIGSSKDLASIAVPRHGVSRSRISRYIYIYRERERYMYIIYIYILRNNSDY